MPTLLAVTARLTRVMAILGSLTLLASNIFALTPSAQAFSNVRVIDQESFILNLDDVALCTKFKYDFGRPTTWEATGYQTCPSETITTLSLPATLHFKFRVQSKLADEFQVSKADAYLLTSKGFKLAISKWKPEPLTKIDGPFNPLNQVFYGAIELNNEFNFRAGTYTLYFELWNTMVNPEVLDLPTPYKVFTFTIGQGVSPAQVDCTAPTAQFPKTLSTAEENVKAINTKVLEINQSARGLAETLRSYRRALEDHISQINQTSYEAASTFESRPSCLEQYRSNTSTIINLANNALSNVAAYLIKAEYAEKIESDPCTIQSLEAKSSVNTSAVEISTIANEISANEAKGGGLIDIKDPQTLAMLKKWNLTIANQSKTLQQWVEKLTVLYKNDVTCANYIDVINLATEKISQGAATTASINGLIAQIDVARAKSEKSSAASSKKDKSGTSDDSLAESDGIEEEPQGNLVATFNNSLNRFVIRVESNLPDESLVVRATKKGSKSLRFTLTTDEDGSGGIRTRTRLSGYTLVLYFGSQKLDQVRLR